MHDWVQGTCGQQCPFPGTGMDFGSPAQQPHLTEEQGGSNPPAAAAGQENPGGGFPWEGTSLLPTPAALQPPQGPRGIPGEGAEKQVFVNSSCHMHEKRQAPQRSRA